jgi:hypothetical protein
LEQECAELVEYQVQQQERWQLAQLIQHLLVDGGTAGNSLLMQLQVGGAQKKCAHGYGSRAYDECCGPDDVLPPGCIRPLLCFRFVCAIQHTHDELRLYKSKPPLQG